jgi:polyisoprenoid-binding protein YceI
MRRVSFGAALACAISSVIWGLHARAESWRYTLDPAQSRVEIHVGKAGLMSFAGHEHLVVGPLASGTVVTGAGDPSAYSVELTFAAVALRVMAAGEPAGDPPKVQEAMLGPQCLDAARYPEIRFVSTAVGSLPDGSPGRRVLVRGRLTLHGVTREVPVEAQVQLEGDALSATGTFQIKQTDFGIQPFSKAGVVKVKDELKLDFRLRGRRAAGR